MMGTKIELNPGLKPGLRKELHETVDRRNVASVWGSGALDVYSTPAMIALMEKASVLAVADFLPEGCSTVGTGIDVKHIASSPIGAGIRAEAVLTGLDGRKLSYEVRAWDNMELIGEGLHERFIIDNKKFMEKTETKRSNQ
ncbi:MAG: thioesterase family protein [Spirochaetaceae bacterium]|jgi:predicted thioesterase|nr:thioesterase family protein [Spirochaetaceae bacterium]